MASERHDAPASHSVDELVERIGRAEHFTPAERRVADFYAASWPGAAFLNLAQVSQASGVSTASVTRFARRIGFDDFKQMIAWFMDGARRDLEKPHDRPSVMSSDHPLADAFARAHADLDASLDSIDPVAFQRVVDLVSDSTRRLYLGSVASGEPFMEHAGMLLAYLRGEVVVLDGTDRWAHQLAGLDARSVVLVAAYDRDPLPLLGLLELVHDTGATSIALTNRPASPLLRLADIALVTSTQRGFMFGSRVTTLAVLEALVDGVAVQQEGQRPRSRAIERAFAALSIHPDNA